MRSLFAAVLLALATGSLTGLAQSSNTNLPFTFQKNVMIPMRDGTKLAANVFIPREGKSFPVILQRTPYGKFDERSGQADWYCAAGYVMVVQDCRGRGVSQGQWEPFRYDADDGFDTQEWVGQQPWCDGHIGTSGASYVGWTQWAAAPRGSHYLTCMAPTVPFADPYREIACPGGAFQISLSFGWGAMVGGLKIAQERMADAFKYLPLSTWDNVGDKQVPYLREWVRHPNYDEFWRVRSIDNRFDKIAVPVLNVGGWYDIFSKATLDHIANMRRLCTNDMARTNQFVIMGPWGHGVGGQKLGELDFGAAAKLDLGRLQFNWFERWLKHKESSLQNWPAVRIFVMGENAWRNESEWPLARTQYTPWYLHGNGKAATRNGDGALNVDLPKTESVDAYTYDPNDPVPTHGGNNLMGPPAGPFDQSAIEDRNDVMVYTSTPLEKPVEVTGPVKVILFASSSAKDTDFTAKLVDVHPNGKAMNMCDGIIRARARDSTAIPTPAMISAWMPNWPRRHKPFITIASIPRTYCCRSSRVK